MPKLRPSYRLGVMAEASFKAKCVESPLKTFKPPKLGPAATL